MPFRLPLSVVLGLQVLIVAAAFTAVILVLSEQQRREFRDSLYQQLSLRQRFVMDSVANPLTRRMAAFDFVVDSYVDGTNGNGDFAAPSDEPADQTLSAVLPFLNRFYMLTRDDQTFQMITVSNQSLVRPAAYANTSRPWKWNVWLVDRAKFVSVANEHASICFATYPVPPFVAASCPHVTTPYPTNIGLGYPPEYAKARRMLSAGNMQSDPTVSGAAVHVMSYSRNWPWLNPTTGEQFYLLFAASIAISHVKPLVEGLSTLPSSRSALFTHYVRLEWGGVEYQMIAAKKDFTDFNLAEPTKPAAWRGGHTPDAVMNAVFFQSVDMFPNVTGSTAFEMEVGGKQYIVSAGRTIIPQYDINWLLFEYTPRDDFFGDSDRARAVGIAIGVVGGAVVLVVCILIWVAIRFPLTALIQSMRLAAEMRNDEVVHGAPILGEIGSLSDAFRQMNNKLLAARPFLPQSLLRAAGTDDDDEDDDGVDEEDDIEMDVLHGGRRAGDKDTSDRVDDGTESTYSSVQRRRGFGDSSTIVSSRNDRASTAVAVKGLGGNHLHANSSNKTLGGAMGLSSRDLIFKRVAVLSINVIGFSNVSHHHGDPKRNANMARLHGLLAKLVEQTVGEERGIVDYFHGDRFVCGFNTARVCGNAARNGAEAAAKIWDRFLSFESSSPSPLFHDSVVGPARSSLTVKSSSNSHPNELLAAFPHGLAMGLGVGRAAVGNHGTDTMQRLATIGSVFTEAMRLQEVMTRRVLMGQPMATVGPAAGAPTAAATVDNHRNSEDPLYVGGGYHTASAGGAVDDHMASGPNPLIAGRCLVMGRVIQDLETTKVYCQIVGAVDARELLTSGNRKSKFVVSRFAKAMNAASAARAGGGVTSTVVDEAFAFSTVPAGEAARTNPTTGVDGAAASSSSNPSSSTVLVAAIVSSDAVRRAAAAAHLAPQPSHRQHRLSGTAGTAAGLANSLSNVRPLGTPMCGRSPTTAPLHALTSEADGATDGASLTTDDDRKVGRNRALSLPKVAGIALVSPTVNAVSVFYVDTNNTNYTPRNNLNNNNNTNKDGAGEGEEEWLYQLQHEQRGNPFTGNNTILYRLWNEAPTTGLLQLLIHQSSTPAIGGTGVAAVGSRLGCSSGGGGAGGLPTMPNGPAVSPRLHLVPSSPNGAATASNSKSQINNNNNTNNHANTTNAHTNTNTTANNNVPYSSPNTLLSHQLAIWRDHVPRIIAQAAAVGGASSSGNGLLAARGALQSQAHTVASSYLPSPPQSSSSPTIINNQQQFSVDEAVSVLNAIRLAFIYTESQMK